MLEKQNICRTITLYNNYIPAIGDEPDWEFCTFGAVDGINVSNNILVNDGRELTEEIWDREKNWKCQLKGEYAAQKIYAVRYDDVEVEQRFWEDNSLPFFFFCRIQCGREKMIFLRDRNGFEKILNISGKTQGITYLTYDNSDLFIVIKSIDYETGAGLINMLHKNMNMISQKDNFCSLKNSFTIMAVRYSWLNSNNKADIVRLDENKIDEVYIKLMEKEGGNIDEIEEEMKKQLEGVKVLKVPVLGSDDAIIVLSSIGWGSFLNLYKSNNGVFGDYNKASAYNKNAAGIVTQICVNNVNNLFNFSQKNKISDIMTGDDMWYQMQVKTLRNKLDRLKDKSNELDIIWNALPKFSGKAFNDYVFFPLLRAMDTLLDLMLKQDQNILDKEPFFDFLTGFCLYVQNTILSDRHVMQILGFNMRIYDIPVKLNAFYNAYLYRISDVLNTNKGCQYDFIAFPGMRDIVSVKELYKEVSEEKRLLKVEIPEYSFYQVHNMMVILTHETAHYVGREFRNRKERSECMVRSYSHIYMNYIKNSFDGEYDFEETLLQEMENRVVSLLSNLLTREYNREYLKNKKYPESGQENLAERNKEKADYLAELIPNIQDAMNDIVIYSISAIYSPVCYNMEIEQEEEFLRKIGDISRYFMEIPIRENTQTYSYSILGKIQILYEESFADLMSVLILQLGLEEYIIGIINSAEYQKMTLDQLLNSEAMLRIAAVIGSIIKTESGFEDWKSDIGKCGNEKDWEKVVSEALWLWTKEAFDEEKLSEKTYENNNYCALKSDNFIIRQAAEYLQLCIERFKEKESDIQGISGVRNIFKVFSGKDCTGEEQIMEMMSFINSYREELLKNTE